MSLLKGFNQSDAQKAKDMLRLKRIADLEKTAGIKLSSRANINRLQDIRDAENMGMAEETIVNTWFTKSELKQHNENKQ